MSESSSDQKIELLVRSVLEAVDARLAEVRGDVQRLAADVGQRLQVLEQRVDVEIANCASTSADASGDTTGSITQRLDALTAALDQLRDGAMTPVSAAPTASMMVGLDEMNAPLRIPTVTGQHPILLDEPPHFALPEESAPATDSAEETVDDFASDEVTADDLMPDGLMPYESIVVEPTPVEPIVDEPVLSESMTSEPIAMDDSPAPIDLNQLADLLSERLSSISLPPR